MHKTVEITCSRCQLGVWGGHVVMGTVWCSDAVCWGRCGVLMLCAGGGVVF